MPGGHFHQHICTRSKRLVNKTDVTAMGTVDIKMVEKFANEIPARMCCFHFIYMLVDVQLLLVVPVLTRYVNL